MRTINKLGALICAALWSIVVTPNRAAAQTSHSGPLAALQDAFVGLAAELEPSVVTVTAHKTVNPMTDLFGSRQGRQVPLGPGRPPQVAPGGPQDGPQLFRAEGTGSGFILTADGWILTNDHVVIGAQRVTVTLSDGREYEGEVRRDYRSDLALIKIAASGLHPAKLGSSAQLKVGQWAIAIGSPFRYKGSLSVGVISALNRVQDIRGSGGDGERIYPDMLQTDAAINPGNSGGPLFNINGEVIGVTTAIESDHGGGLGIGFAIPIDDVRFVVDALRTTGKVAYGYIGILPQTVTAGLASSYRVDHGALVVYEPDPSSPAGKAGIHADDVILNVGDKPILSEADLRLSVSRMRPGTVAPVTLLREGTQKNLKVTIQAAPEIPLPGGAAPAAKSTDIGLQVAALTTDAAKRVGLDVKVVGVLVRTVDSAGPASETDLTPGDVILKVNGKAVATPAEYLKATSGVHRGDIVRLLVAGARTGATFTRVALVSVD